MSEKREKLENWGLYKSFEELARHEKRGKDYEILVQQRNSRIALIAPHGGYIEPGTTEVALLLADENHSFYSFCGLEEKRGPDLHITSHLFDEPQALALAETVEHVVTVHSMPGDDPFVLIGGRCKALAELVTFYLANAGFVLANHEKDPRCRGMHKKNICNRGLSGEGVQLELSAGLFALLAEHPVRLAGFQAATQKAFEDYKEHNV